MQLRRPTSVDRMLSASVVLAFYKAFSGAWVKCQAFALHHRVSAN
jgi:hypothetical protein